MGWSFEVNQHNHQQTSQPRARFFVEPSKQSNSSSFSRSSTSFLPHNLLSSPWPFSPILSLFLNSVLIRPSPWHLTPLIKKYSIQELPFSLFNPQPALKHPLPWLYLSLALTRMSSIVGASQNWGRGPRWWLQKSMTRQSQAILFDLCPRYRFAVEGSFC